ncbi:MAG: hypothetical protein DRP01_04205 [Archaeoglobales archaeon]|nr:MAG: hypothetical protein DRP01_04205 [Archaeoglobales archaeon]
MAKKRFAHKLKSNKSKAFPRYIIFFDVETKQHQLDNRFTRQEFYLAVACYCKVNSGDFSFRKKWAYFTNIEDLWNWIVEHAKPRQRLYLVAHNVAFDFIVVRGFTNLFQRGFELLSFYEKKPTTIIEFGKPTLTFQRWREKGKGKENYRGRRYETRIVVLDNLNLFKGQLQKWGKLMNLPKLEIDFAKASDRYLREYCKRDVEIMVTLWEWWYKFLLENDLGAFGKTVATQAFNAYRHRFMPVTIWIHNDDSALALEREAYHGGMVRCFRLGRYEGQTFYKLDVNSMYPYVMYMYQMPCDYAGSLYNVGIDKLEKLLQRYAVIAKVELNTKDDCFPYLLDNHLCYPVGSFTTTLTTPELKYALEHGYIAEIYQLAYYRQAFLFKDYVQFFYRLKQQYDKEGNRLLRQLCKLFLNSLYGKFGQYATEMKEFGHLPKEYFAVETHIDSHTLEKFYIYKIGRVAYVRQVVGEGFNAFPAIAAHITAYARMYLWELINLAGRENVFYCDTDSLIVNEQGYQNLLHLISPTDLGKLKVEDRANRLIVYGRKDYVFGHKVKRKGIRSKAVQIAPGIFLQEIFPSIRGIMARFGKEEYYTIREVKALKRNFRYGIIEKDGRVKPFRLRGGKRAASFWSFGLPLWPFR